MTALDAQTGRAKTAPYTNANAVTAATPTLLTGSQLKTVQEPPAQPRRSSALPAVIIVLVIALAAAAAFIATHRSAPQPVTQTVAPKPQPAAPSATSVSVTAPPAIIEEKKPEVPAPTTTTSQAVETTPQTPTTTTEDVAPVPQPQPANEPRADALFATAMGQLLGGDWQESRKTLHRVLKQDPHYAKAHFRMGEIALLNRNLIPAAEELNLALADSDRLNPREQQLTRIGLALTERNRPEIHRLADEIAQQWPGDPDLDHMRNTFPGMFLERRRR
jgi:tetratricopeptide (TPR) repeat protein